MYCPRNYCALLVRIHEITEDVNIIREYYYTSKHYSRIFCGQITNALKSIDYEQSVYYTFNLGDLELIKDGNYPKHQDLIDSINHYKKISMRQIETIRTGVSKLHNDMIATEKLLNLI